VNIIDRLLFREVLKALAVVMIVLLAVLLANSMVSFLGKAAAGAITPDGLLLLVGLEIITEIGAALPPAFFLSLLWVLGGMYRDSEMVALQACGVGTLRIYRSVMLLALPVTFFTAVLFLSLRPWASDSIEHIKYVQRASADISTVRAGRFNEYSGGRLVVYAQGRDNTTDHLQQVFIQDRQRGSFGVVTASEAYQSVDEQTGARFIVLRNGTRYEGVPGRADYVLMHFEEYALRVPVLDLGMRLSGIEEQPLSSLWASDHRSARAELEYRIFVPISVLIFALLAVPLARSQPRKEVHGRVGLAVLVYFMFLGMQRLARGWMIGGVGPDWLGIWWVVLVMLAVAGLLLLLDSSWLTARLRRRRERLGR